MRMDRTDGMDDRTGAGIVATGLSRRGMATLAITAVLCAALIALLAVRLSTAGRVASNLPPFPLIGHEAPAFSMKPWNAQGKAVAGSSVTLDSFIGHPLVLNFWGSWCAECAEEQPVLRAAW